MPVLEHALQIQKKAHRVQDLEIENKQLRETLDEYNHEFAEVKNQGESLRDRDFESTTPGMNSLASKYLVGDRRDMKENIVCLQR